MSLQLLPLIPRWSTTNGIRRTPMKKSTESRVDIKKAKGSMNNHAATHDDIQHQQSSALDRVHSAIQKNLARQARIKASGREWIPGPRRQIYIGNIAFDAMEHDGCETITGFTHTKVYNCIMPRSGNRNRGYAFVTIAWPFEFKGGVE